MGLQTARGSDRHGGDGQEGEVPQHGGESGRAGLRRREGDARDLEGGERARNAGGEA